MTQSTETKLAAGTAHTTVEFKGSAADFSLHVRLAIQLVDLSHEDLLVPQAEPVTLRLFDIGEPSPLGPFVVTMGALRVTQFLQIILRAKEEPNKFVSAVVIGPAAEQVLADFRGGDSHGVSVTFTPKSVLDDRKTYPESHVWYLVDTDRPITFTR